MSYMYVNNIGSFAGSVFQKATIQLSFGNERSTKTTAAGTKDSSEVQNTSSNSDSKLKRILSKFRAGHKLTPAELQYLLENAPEMYQKVVQIQRQREQLESQIKSAGTKEEAQKIVTDKISMCMKSGDSGDNFTQDATINQFQDALKKFVNSSEGQGKQDTTVTKNKNSEEQLKTDKTTDLKTNDIDDETEAFISNTYASSGDFEEERKQSNGKHLSLKI